MFAEYFSGPVEQSVRCVCLCVWPITFEQSDNWIGLDIWHASSS